MPNTFKEPENKVWEPKHLQNEIISNICEVAEDEMCRFRAGFIHCDLQNSGVGY